MFFKAGEGLALTPMQSASLRAAYACYGNGSPISTYSKIVKCTGQSCLKRFTVA